MANKPETKSIGRQLNFSTGAINTLCARLLEPHGLGLAQWVVLATLWRRGPTGVSELAETTGNKPAAVSRLIDRMVTAGLLLRQPVEGDRRAVRITLTESGEALRHLEAFHETINALVLEGFTEAETEQFHALLARAEANARDATPSARDPLPGQSGG